MTEVNSMAAGNLVVFVMLLFYLVAHTGIASMMIMDKEGILINSINVNGNSINPIINSDFNNPVVNQSLRGSTQYSGIWTLGDDGSYTLTDASVGTGIEPTLVIDNIISQNGVYTNEYIIDNVPLTRFNIIIRKSASEINFLDNIVLVFDNNEIYIPSNIYGKDFSLPYDGILGASMFSIRTVFDSTHNTLDIYLDNGLTAHIENLHSLSGLSISHFYYCGVQSYDIGFKWISISTTIGVQQNTDFLSVAGNFFNTVLGLFNFLVPSEYYPIPLEKALLFDVPLFGLIVFAVMVFRGD
jgi:hypothetical protein